jgi:hypothetical protein
MARERTPVVPASMAMTTLIRLLSVQLGLTRWIDVAWDLLGVNAAGRQHCRNNQDDSKRNF